MAETNEVLEKMPMLYVHCLDVYNAMADQSSVTDLGVEYGNEEGLVYEGFTTKLVTEELGLSVPYYTKIMNELKRMDCIRQLRRGGSTTPSRWALLQEPTRELYQKMRPSQSRSKGTSWRAQMEQRIKDLNERVAKLER